MKSIYIYPVLAAFSLFAISCQPTGQGGNRTPGGGPGSTMATGPVAAYADVEVFGEHPLTAFQRTGQPPLPITTFTAGTPLNLTARSGAFYQMILPDGAVTWIAARDVAGNVPRLPEVVPGSRPQPPTGNPGGTGYPPTNNNSGFPAGPGQDVIDLDRLGGG